MLADPRVDVVLLDGLGMRTRQAALVDIAVGTSGAVTDGSIVRQELEAARASGSLLHVWPPAPLQEQCSQA